MEITAFNALLPKYSCSERVNLRLGEIFWRRGLRRPTKSCVRFHKIKAAVVLHFCWAVNALQNYPGIWWARSLPHSKSFSLRQLQIDLFQTVYIEGNIICFEPLSGELLYVTLSCTSCLYVMTWGPEVVLRQLFCNSFFGGNPFIKDKDKSK